MKAPAKVLVPLFALALLSLSAYSYLELDHHLPYPTMGEIKSNYHSLVGSRVSVPGIVLGGDEKSTIISSDSLSFRCYPLNASVGDRVEILGVLEENYHITVEKSVVYDKLGYYSIFLRSLAGAALLAFFFLKNWKFDARKIKFSERG